MYRHRCCTVARWAWILVLVCVWATPLLAQGRLTGKVSGPDGKGLSGVVIKMLPETEGYTTSETKSNKKGKFVFGLLRKDTYRLVAFHEGMRVAYIDALIAKPDDPDFWSYDGEIPPGAEMPKFAVDGLSTVTYDMKFAAYDGPLGEYGTGVPQDPVKVITEQLEAGRMEEAVAEARKVAADNPDSATAHYLLGFALVSTGDNEGAEAAARKTLEIDPVFEGGETLLGRALEAQGRLDEAAEAYARQIDKASTEQVRSEAILAAAVANEKLGRDAEAAEYLERIVAEGSTDARVYKELADLYLRTDQPDKAREMMTRISEMGEADPLVLYNLGAERFNEGDFAGAVELFRKVIDADPSMADAYRQLAYALLNQGDRSGAVEALGHYLDLEPEESEAAASARTIYEQLKKTESP